MPNTAKAKTKTAPQKQAKPAAENKKSAKLEATETAEVANRSSNEDLEDLEEQAEAAASAASSAGGPSAAQLAAGGPTEMSASFKNFRHHPDMENFYRFIYDNDLRHEALAIIDEILIEKRKRREMKSSKTNAH